MAKKTLKDAANAGTSVFDQIASGNVRNVPDVQDVQKVQNVKKTQNAQKVKNVQPAQDVPDAPDAKNKGGRPSKYKVPMERLNLRIPVELREYLQAAAYRESSPKKMVSLTEYLVKIIREDMEKHPAD